MTAVFETSVTISVLKARISEFLRMVRAGHSLTVLDGDMPVARVVPYERSNTAFSVRPPRRSLRDLELPPPLSRPVDSLGALEEERQSSR
jgi:antitoxin (DNA-binding transcriptional repressor) of toxin-antitoxin stability system